MAQTTARLKEAEKLGFDRSWRPQADADDQVSGAFARLQHVAAQFDVSAAAGPSERGQRERGHREPGPRERE